MSYSKFQLTRIGVPNRRWITDVEVIIDPFLLTFQIIQLRLCTLTVTCTSVYSNYSQTIQATFQTSLKKVTFFTGIIEACSVPTSTKACIMPSSKFPPFSQKRTAMAALRVFSTGVICHLIFHFLFFQPLAISDETETDRDALLCFKSQLSGPTGVLASWNNASLLPCNWQESSSPCYRH